MPSTMRRAPTGSASAAGSRCRCAASARSSSWEAAPRYHRAVPQRPLDDWDLADLSGEAPPTTRIVSAAVEERSRAALAERAARLAEDLAAIARQERPR